MSKENIIEGCSICPKCEAGCNQVERSKKILEDLSVAMDKLQVDPRECVLEITDMGEAFQEGGSWVYITKFKIKPIEKGFRSLVNYYNELSYAVGWDGDKYNVIDKIANLIGAAG